MARGKGTGKKSGSKPTSKPRTKKQTARDRYAHAREDAQLLGLIPTTPEEALKSEVVPAASQAEVPQPGLIEQAIRSGWAVSEDRKPGLVAELVAMMDNPEVPHKVKVAAFSALLRGDQQQYERDHPEQVAKAKGGTTVAIVNSVQIGDVFDDIERDIKVITEKTGDAAPAGGVQADGDAEPVDEAQPDIPLPEREAD